MGVTRDEVVRAGLDLVAEAGLGGLTMRTLADRLGVKAASLYWHVRDRDELVDWLAAALLDEVTAPGNGSWRERALAVGTALDTVIARHPGSADVLLAASGGIASCRPALLVRDDLEAAGLAGDDAAGVAGMLVAHVVLARRGRGPVGASGDDLGGASSPSPGRRRARLTVENLSRGIRIVGARGLDRPAVPVAGRGTSASVSVSGDGVVVRRLRGAGTAEVRIDATARWTVRVKGPALRIRLDLAGVDVERLKLDGGVRDVEAVLPAPTASLPIEISGGVSQVRLHRRPGTAVAATAHGGALGIRLDGQSMAVVGLNDWHWSAPGAPVGGRIDLDVSGGAADVTLDASAVGAQPAPPTNDPGSSGDAATALEILLDGVERRLEGAPGGR